MYEPISIQREPAHCLSQKGNINISIFVRGRVNIIRWVWFAPLRLLREIVWNQCCVWHPAHCLITLLFLTATTLIYFFRFNRGGRFCLSFTYTVSFRTLTNQRSYLLNNHFIFLNKSKVCSRKDCWDCEPCSPQGVLLHSCAIKHFHLGAAQYSLGLLLVSTERFRWGSWEWSSRD